MSIWNRLPTPHTSFIIGTSVATTLALVAIAQITLQTPSQKTIPSPRSTQLPKLSKAEQGELPYPPDVFPGARDVDSPYGAVRVYEWGPESGRKVLLVHGISTPCIALGGVANALVEKGCRVMLLDLWGRGYSDSVDLPHDGRLYSTEILLAITSSPLAWTPGGFSLVGYSLGGGIVVDFAASFPLLVKDVVLLAPAGIIRQHHFGWSSRLMYSGAIPDSVLRWVVRRRLRAPLISKKEPPKPESAAGAVSEEIKGARNHDFENSPLSKTRPGVTVALAVQWQLHNHDGFVNSFVSSIKFASIQGNQATWKKLGLRNDKILIFAGRTDSLIIPAELEGDALETIGAGKVDFRIIEGGHEFPITRGDEVVEQIAAVWGI